METRETYLGLKSDFYTHVHDLPPQLGGASLAVAESILHRPNVTELLFHST